MKTVKLLSGWTNVGIRALPGSWRPTVFEDYYPLGRCRDVTAGIAGFGKCHVFRIECDDTVADQINADTKYRIIQVDKDETKDSDPIQLAAFINSATGLDVQGLADCQDKSTLVDLLIRELK